MNNDIILFSIEDYLFFFILFYFSSSSLTFIILYNVYNDNSGSIIINMDGLMESMLANDNKQR